MATTVNSDFILSATPFVGKPFQTKLNRVQNAKTNAPYRPNGIYAFDTGSTLSVPATSSDDTGDEYFVITFPANCLLLGLRYTSADRDTNATPALVEDVIVENSAGTEVVLINDTTVGQAGGDDLIDTGTDLYMMDVSGQKLGIKNVTGAATAAAGNIRFRGLVYIGENDYSIVKF